MDLNALAAANGAARMKSSQRTRLSLADLRDPTAFPKSDYIELLYQVMLQRTPDPNGLRSYSRREDIHNFFGEILNSAEFKEKSRNTAYFSGRAVDRKRILLFGAYGNGNLGDAIQATSLLHAIKCIRQDLEVWACSLLPCQFPFPFEYVLPPNQIFNASVLNHFDLIIIGGGGLLAHPHDPLTSEEWQAAVDVPIALFGIGAGGQVASRCNTLITKAVYVSGRDEPSLTALSRFRGDAQFVPDPVLADPRYYAADGDDRQPHATNGKRLWIIKNTPIGRNSGVLRHVDPTNDDICFLEPFLDFPLLNMFPTAHPLYFLDDFLCLIDKATEVISMRYHGCILAMLRNKPVIGLFEQKSCDLLRRYGLGRFFSGDGLGFPNSSSGVRAGDKITEDREVFQRELTKILSLLDTTPKSRW
jgi:Polysaccharide pyruvyl transferase